MSGESGYTADDAALANRVLREALGLPPQTFATEQFVGMISDEIEALRRAGKSDDDIARMLEGVGLEIDSASIARFYASPNERGRPDPA